MKSEATPTMIGCLSSSATTSGNCLNTSGSMNRLPKPSISEKPVMASCRSDHLTSASISMPWTNTMPNRTVAAAASSGTGRTTKT